MSREQPKGPVAYVFSKGSCIEHMHWIQEVFSGNKDFVMMDSKDKTKVVHASMQVNGGPLYLSDRIGEYGAPPKEFPSSLGTHLFLGYNTEIEAREAWIKALNNKGKVLMELEQQNWGAIYGVVEDPFGSAWAICARVKSEDDDGKKALSSIDEESERKKIKK